MGSRDDDDTFERDVLADLQMALSRCPILDRESLRDVLAEYGLAVVRVHAVDHAGSMLRDTLKKKPKFKISFVADPSDRNSPVVAVDFAASEVEAEAKALSTLALHREKGATGWRITGLDNRPVAIGPERT